MIAEQLAGRVAIGLSGGELIVKAAEEPVNTVLPNLRPPLSPVFVPCDPLELRRASNARTHFHRAVAVHLLLDCLHDQVRPAAVQRIAAGMYNPRPHIGGSDADPRQRRLTQVYAERDLEGGKRVMAEIG